MTHHDDAEACEVEAACGHLLSPEREDLPPCEACERCEGCCTCDDPAADALDAAVGVDREWRLHRGYPLDSEDGQPTRVLVCRMPAAFYRIEALPYGDKPGFALSTGSGHAMARLAEQMAEAISQGMLGLARPEEA